MIREVVRMELQKLELDADTEVFASMTDNGSNMIAAMGGTCGATLPCVCHTLHLSVKPFLKHPRVHQVMKNCPA